MGRAEEIDTHMRSMESNNPVFGRSEPLRAASQGVGFHTPAPTAEDVAAIYSTPQRMTLDDVIVKTGILLAIVVGVGAATWYLQVPLGIVMLAGIAGFVLALSAVLVVFWHAHEQARLTEEQLRDALREGDSSVEARLAETERIRADLIGTVSHEFRTPLTGIRGAALTLLKRGDRLDPASRTALLNAVLDQQERLSRLLENMLIAARATAVDPGAISDVDAVAAEVAMLASAGRPGAGPVSVVVEPQTTARIDRQALHQVLANLVDNALQHGAVGAVPLVAGGRDERGVWMTVSNEGRVLDLTAAERLFEPFTQLDSGATRNREGIGVGLYVVRRLVDVYGGSVDVRSDSGWVTVEVRLQPAGSPRLARLEQPA
ncbi:MAG: Bax inhibitor-1/YccA family protein [Proteobacteria bacterium]|nr:Bax inhibitor-1/YccA family protein [Pseudomonadota bacterium]